jgi:hypothetical protein
MCVEEATESLLESPYGIHALVVYTDMIMLREFWSFYAKKSLEKNELLLLAPFYQTIESVRETLSIGHKAIDVQRYEKEEKSLIIVDALEKYMDKDAGEFNVKALLKAIDDLAKYAENVLKKEWISFLGDSGAFLFKNQLQSLLDYESSLPRQFDINLKGICLYHEKDFDRLSTDQKKEIINHHKIAIKV